jgi:hypothetical protein
MNTHEEIQLGLKQINLKIDESAIFSQEDKLSGMRSLLNTRFYIYSSSNWAYPMNGDSDSEGYIYVCWYFITKNRYDNEYYQHVPFEYVLDNVSEDIQTKLLFNLDLFT